MPKHRPEGEPNQITLKEVIANVHAGITNTLYKAHDRLNAEQQFAIKLGLPDNRFDWGQIDQLCGLLYKKFENKKQVVRDIEGWLKQEHRNHPNPLSPEQFRLLTAYLAAHAHWQFKLFSVGAFSVSYYRPGRRMKSTAWEEGDVQLIAVPDVFPPFYSPKPLSYLSDMAHYGWNRGFNTYDDLTKEDPAAILERHIQKKGKITLLDEGRGDACFLGEAKKKYGRSVRTLGAGLVNTRFPDRPIDDDYIGSAEIMPGRWTNSADVIVSYQAYRYFLFPERALEETLRILKPDGDAYLDIAMTEGKAPLLQEYLDELGINESVDKLLKQNFSGFKDVETTLATVQRIAQKGGYTISATCVSGSTSLITNHLHIHKHA